MDAHESIWERRRYAPAHYWAKACNARYSAYLLSAQSKDHLVSAAKELGYGGDPRIARHESMIREGAISIELILKCVVAARIQTGQLKKSDFCFTHDLAKLWHKAAAEPLEDADELRLLKLTQRLYWSGRYGAPKEDKDYEREKKKMARLSHVEVVDNNAGLAISQPLSITFDDIDRIWQKAASNCPDWDDPNYYSKSG